MSRAVLLPTMGDPFLLQFWLNLYKTYWKDEIDSLYVYVNSPIPDEIVVYDSELLTQAGAKRIFYANNAIDHGKALEDLLDVVEEDDLLIIEDDGFVFKSGKIDYCFKRLDEGYKIVASKRGSCSAEILEMAATKWGLNYEGYGDQGCNFWPNFLFMETNLLKSIGGHFGATAWQAGDMLEGLEMRCQEFCNGDTFVSASLRLRRKLDEIIKVENMGDQLIWYENQYHGATDDIIDYHNRDNIFDGLAAWTHAGSLSSGITNLLDINKPLPKSMASTDQEKLELERRVMYWEIFWENALNEGIEEYHKEYAKAIRRLIGHYDLNEGRIEQRKRAYYELFPRFNMRDFNAVT